MKPKVVKDYKFPQSKEEMPFGPGSEAGVLIEVNSGWRTFRPVIDHEKCIKCLICWVICPDGVISKDTPNWKLTMTIVRVAAFVPMNALKSHHHGERR